MRKSTLILMFFLTLFFSTVFIGIVALGQNPTRDSSVGVRVGDWIKYRVRRLGWSAAWTPPPMEKAEWIKVEVQEISGTALTIHVTIGLIGGRQVNRTYIKDLQKIWFSKYYIVAADLNAGDKIGVDETVWINSTDSIRVQELWINSTVSRSYGETIREVNWLRWSYLRPFFGHLHNFTEEYYFDKKTGFLVERTWQMYDPRYGNASMSTLQLEIADTNLWKMETGDESMWNQLWPWTAVGLVLATVAGTTIFMKMSKNSTRKRKEVYEK